MSLNLPHYSCALLVGAVRHVPLGTTVDQTSVSHPYLHVRLVYSVVHMSIMEKSLSHRCNYSSHIVQAEAHTQRKAQAQSSATVQQVCAQPKPKLLTFVHACCYKKHL
jgi:hypothetical protein